MGTVGGRLWWAVEAEVEPRVPRARKLLERSLTPNAVSSPELSEIGDL